MNIPACINVNKLLNRYFGNYGLHICQIFLYYSLSWCGLISFFVEKLHWLIAYLSFDNNLNIFLIQYYNLLQLKSLYFIKKMKK